MASKDKIAGAFVILKAPEEHGGPWTVEQEPDQPVPMPNRGSLPFTWNFGPTSLEGYVDVDELSIVVSARIAGVNTGNISGNLEDGVLLNFDLSITKGNLGLYLKNGNELWVHQHVPIKFDGTFDGHYKILTL